MKYTFIGAVLGVAALIGSAQAGENAAENTASLNFAVLRNGEQIGTDTIRVAHDGTGTVVQNDTHVSVGFGMLTLYRYDQSESERWAGGRLVALQAKTDNNGTEHNTSAEAKDGKLVVRVDDRVNEVPPTAVPLSLWNSVSVDSNVAFDPEDGSVQPMKVIDHGEEKLVVRGKECPAHHYQLVTKFPQDVWYDGNNQLVQVELKGSDGSTIRYQLI